MGESLTYRQFLDAVLQMVETAETALMKENPTFSRSFGPTKNHESRVDTICNKFPKICQIPVYGPKGLFDFELLWRPILEARLKQDRTLEAVVWPFAICSEWTEADGRSVGPSSVGRHDRIHLRIFTAELLKISNKETPTILHPKLSFEKISRGIEKCLETTKDQKLRHLSMLLFYGLHEALPRFFIVLETKCPQEIKQAFLNRAIDVLGPKSHVDPALLEEMLTDLSRACQESRRAGCLPLGGI